MLPPKKRCKKCDKRFEPASPTNLFCSDNCCRSLRRSDKKAYVDERKKKGCTKCGYDKCLSSLHYHHLDPTTKTFALSEAFDHSLDVIDAEIALCILVCANCHSEIHKENE